MQLLTYFFAISASMIYTFGAKTVGGQEVCHLHNLGTLALHEKRPLPGGCALAECLRGNNIKVTSCPIYSTGSLICSVVKGNVSLPYPHCCDEIHCSHPTNNGCKTSMYNLGNFALYEKKQVPNQCSVVECLPNNEFYIHKCRQYDIEGFPECTIVPGIQSFSYPKCCDTLQCPEGSAVLQRQ